MKLLQVLGLQKSDSLEVTDLDRQLLSNLLHNFSIEVMPRSLAKIENLSDLLPPKTRVYIAHIEGTPFADMCKAAERLQREGFQTMPHIPARLLENKNMLQEWVQAYSDLGIHQALLLAGGLPKPRGCFSSSMQLLETELFDQYQFKRIHVAGHPEGNRDIDVDGSEQKIMQALKWKTQFAERSDAEFAIATQFCFDEDPVIQWANRLTQEGIAFPIHLGVAGPARLQTLLKFAINCGVGPSLKVLQRRAKDASKLLLPFEPTDFLVQLARKKEKLTGNNIEALHFFPLGGIESNIKWIKQHT